MKRTPHVKVEIAGLKPAHYDFSFEIDDKFFGLFPGSFIEHGHLKVNIQLDFGNSLVRCLVDVAGKVELTCDRSLDTFWEDLSFSEPIIFKFGEEAKELSDEIEIISWKETHLDFSQFIYDFIALSIPIKKLHPKFRTSEEDSSIDDILLYSSSTDEVIEEKPIEVDSRWEKLLNLNLINNTKLNS